MSVTPAAVPVPVTATVWGDALALSETETFAERGPVAAGWNLTEIVQFAFGAKGEFARQVFVWEKSDVFAPVILTPDIASGAEPVLVTVIGCAAVVTPTFSLLKSSEVGENTISGVAGTSVPESETVTVCVELFVGSVIERPSCAERKRPLAGGGGAGGGGGANCTAIVHCVPGARVDVVEAQVLEVLSSKSAEFIP